MFAVTHTSPDGSCYVQAFRACRSDSEYTKMYTKMLYIGGETKGKFFGNANASKFCVFPKSISKMEK